MSGITAATITKQGFMKKVEFFSGPHEGATVHISDRSLDIREDRDEIYNRAVEEVA